MIESAGRRHFIKQTTAALTAPMIVPASVLGKGGQAAPSERVTLGIIGIGGRTAGLFREFFAERESQFVAVCDVHDWHYRDLEKGKRNPCGREAGKIEVEKKYGKGCSTYVDYHEICAREDIDAVIVATPDHWHALQTLETLKSGKDVYCEKPITHFFAEGRVICDEAARQNAVFQVGSQQRSEKNFQRGVELVRNGHLGKIQRVEVGLPSGHRQAVGDTTIEEPPEGLDYDFWTGPAEKLPYMRARHHRNWRWHSAYGGGQIMDWIGHHNDIAHWGLGMENSGPVRVEAKNFTWPETEFYDTPVHYEIRCEYADGITSVIGSKVRKGAKWIGENGWVFVDRGKIETSNPAWLEKSFDTGEWKASESNRTHAGNFLECVKSRKTTVAPAENGHRSITPGHLSYVSQELGRALRWNPATEQIEGDDEAQKLLMAMPYREPWELK